MWDNQSPEMQSKPIPPFASFKNWSYSEFSCEALEQWLTVPITGSAKSYEIILHRSDIKLYQRLDRAISDVLTHFKNEFENQYNTIIDLTTRKLQSIMTPQMLEVCVDVTLVIDHNCYGRILLAMEESSTINISSIELLEPIETDERNNNDDCLVCLDEIGEETQVLRLPCSHMFHGDCITKWLENSHYCPLCRFQMPTD
ncbi:ERAD-associated E3 ubiquitin-protein ligase HRD1-like [Solanum tuberosum]|nr:PREDICTED: ERAD-associated E3 ubiquitin-protein ligase HRD1-like [Solanum tuberosum]